MIPRAALAAVLGAQAVLTAELVAQTSISHRMLWLYCLSLPLFGAAVWLLARSRLSARTGMLVILGAAAVLQLVALTKAPATSDDDFRYIWDAKVQLSGIDPYRYVPQDPHLAGLRDTFLFPTDRCPYAIPGGCTAINRPAVHTVYPPVAEGAFVVIRLASFGGHGGHLPIQLAGALGTLLIAWLLARRALARGRPLWTAALWAWCPLTIIEFSSSGHIDWLAILFVVLGLGAAARRPGLAGGLIGAAIVTKLYPVVVLPALLRRRPKTVLAAAAAVVVISYIPHVIAVGRAVIGYLPGYLQEEQYDSGGRLMLLGQVLPHPADTVVGLLILAAVAWWAVRHADPDEPERAAVVLMGATLLVATPAYGWYAGLLLALVAMSGALEWLPVALAPTLIYLVHQQLGGTADIARPGYLAAALLTAVLYLLLRTDSLRRCRQFASTTTVRLRSSRSTARR